MSYTTTLDGDTLQCRASIESQEEMDLYVKHLEKQKERLHARQTETARKDHPETVRPRSPDASVERNEGESK